MTDLRTLENDSIRAFVQKAADEGYLSGRVLDYGCGKQPYRDIVEAAGGDYYGVDSPDFPGSTATERTGDMNASSIFDNVLCTQVLQYIEDPLDDCLEPLREDHMVPGGHLVLTYPTNWPEVELEDLHRFTKAGMERLLIEAGFTILRHERRAEIEHRRRVDGRELPVEVFALGYGVICRA